MPDPSYAADQRPDVFTWTLDGELGPGFAQLGVPLLPQVRELRTASTGPDPIGAMVVGNAVRGEVIVTSTTEAELRLFLNLASSGIVHNLPIGTILPKKELTLHDASLPTGTDSGDITLLNVSFLGVELVTDGTEEERRFRVPYIAQMDPETGRVWRIGPEAEPEPEPEA